MIIWAVYFNCSTLFSFLSWATNNGFEVPLTLSCFFSFCWIPKYYSAEPSFIPILLGLFGSDTSAVAPQTLAGFSWARGKRKVLAEPWENLLGDVSPWKNRFFKHQVSWHKTTFWWDIPEGFNSKFCWLLEICRICINTFCRPEVGL